MLGSPLAVSAGRDGPSRGSPAGPVWLRKTHIDQEVLMYSARTLLVPGCFFREVLLRAEDFRPKAA